MSITACNHHASAHVHHLTIIITDMKQHPS
jgi:hypothetical protein